MRKKLLVIEDNKQVLEILAFALGQEGYQIIRADSGSYGLHLAKEYLPDLIIIDLERKEPGNFEICRELREAGIHKPILLFLSSEKEADMLSALDLNIGYIQTPFHMKELLMLINVNIWDVGSEMNSGNPAQFLAFGRIEVDTEQVLVLKDGLPIELTQREYDLLCRLASEPGKVFSREELLELVWGYTYMFAAEIRSTGSSVLESPISLSASGLSVRFSTRISGWDFWKSSSKKAMWRTIPRPLVSSPAFCA